MSSLPMPTLPLSQPQKNEIVYVDFFGKKISRAAFYTLVAGILFALTISLFIPYGGFIGLYILLVFLLMSYNVNCAQVGHCHVWAWILTTIYIVYVILSVIIILTNPTAWIKIHTGVSAPAPKGSVKELIKTTIKKGSKKLSK
jgi:hypothetical protein